LDLAEAYKILGDDRMKEYELYGNKEFARDAHEAYSSLEEFDRGQYDVYSLMDMSLQAATIHILLEADSWDYNHRWRIDNKFRYIENESRNYRKVFFEDLPEIVDCHLRVEFNKLDVDEALQTTRDNFSKDIVDSYESYTDSTGTKHEKPIYKTVNASVKCETTIKTYNWEARVEVDFIRNYCDFHSSNYRAEYELESKRYAVTGDERALPEEMKDLKDIEEDIKEERIIDDMIDSIFKKVQRDYFR
jgi:hypothetical protein